MHMGSRGDYARTQAIRLVQLVRLLEAGGSFTAKEAAARFGCSKRTIERDVFVLDLDLGRPIVEERFRYSLLKD